jgi:hypothetical protein
MLRESHARTFDPLFQTRPISVWRGFVRRSVKKGQGGWSNAEACVAANQEVPSLKPQGEYRHVRQNSSPPHALPLAPQGSYS